MMGRAPSAGRLPGSTTVSASTSPVPSHLHSDHATSSPSSVHSATPTTIHSRGEYSSPSIVDMLTSEKRMYQDMMSRENPSTPQPVTFGGPSAHISTYDPYGGGSSGLGPAGGHSYGGGPYDPNTSVNRSRYSTSHDSSQEAWARIPAANKPAVIKEELPHILTITPLAFDPAHRTNLALFHEILEYQPPLQRG